MPFCQKCGEAYSEGEDFCGNCGARLHSSLEVASRNDKREDSNEHIAKLQQYVNKLRSQGKTDGEILSSLKQVGWGDDMIDHVNPPLKIEEVETAEKRVTPIADVFSWIVGILLVILALRVFTLSWISGMIIILVSLLIIPPGSKFVKKNLSFELSGEKKAVIVMLMLVLVGIVTPFQSSSNIVEESSRLSESDSQSQDTGDISYADESYCSPSWECGNWTCWKDNIKTRSCVDINNCNTSEGRPPGTGRCVYTYEVNEIAMVDDLAYAVTDVSFANSVGNTELGLGDSADGVYIIITLRVENRGSESKTIFSPRFTFLDQEWRSFSEDTEAELWSSLDTIGFSEQFHPGVPKKGVLIFDIPRETTSFFLKIGGDWLSTDEVLFDLGPYLVEKYQQ